MVQITTNDGNLSIEILRIHKVLALKSRLQFPLSSVSSVRIDPQFADKPLGWKAPGTYIPRMITAGTFYHNKKRLFWDVSNPDNALVIELEGEKYQILIVEVEKPGAVAAQIEAARNSSKKD